MCAPVQSQVRAPGRAFHGPVGATVVAQEFQPGRSDAGLAESCLDRFHQHVAHGLARQATFRPGAPGNDFAVTAILHEHTGHHFAIVARDLKAVRASPLIGFVHRHHAIVHAAAY